MKDFKTGFFSIACAGLLLGCSLAQSSAVGPSASPAQTPQEATYLIDGNSYVLSEGQATAESAPGSASKVHVQIFGEPVTGDLDGDGIPDAAVLLVETTGGSGTFYFVAAALNRGGTFVGSEAVFIGDRIAPQQLRIRHGVVILDYADRRPGEAMALPPSQEQSLYLVNRGGQLAPVRLAEGEVIAAGAVVIGHEVRSFTPCGVGEAVWLTGDSVALPAIQIAYDRDMSDASPYTPLFMVLTGHPAGPPVDGFGADYAAGFRAVQLVHVLRGVSCLPPEKISE